MPGLVRPLSLLYAELTPFTQEGARLPHLLRAPDHPRRTHHHSDCKTTRREVCRLVHPAFRQLRLRAFDGGLAEREHARARQESTRPRRQRLRKPLWSHWITAVPQVLRAGLPHVSKPPTT